MKKRFPLEIPDRKPGLVLDAIKHEIRKYLKRERRKPVPEGVDFWDFDCRFGATEEAASIVHLNDITGLIDAIVKEAGKQFYVEILAKPGHRKARPAGEAGAAA